MRHFARTLVCALAAIATAVMATAAVAAPETGIPAARGGVAGAGAIPAGFIAQSISWVSPSDGWVLGTTQCGKSGNCPKSEVISTTNAGKTWRRIGVIPASIPRMGNPGTGITEIKFVTSKVGWAFAPDLFRTANGGKTWHPVTIPGHAKQVLDLAASATEAYSVVSPCAFATGDCSTKPLTTWRIGLTGTTWTKMSVSMHFNVAADVGVFGSSVYLVDPRIDGPHLSKLYVSTDGGRHFAARPVPCDSTSEFNLIQAVPYSATSVGLLCDGNPGFSKAVKTVYLSTDTGKTDTSAGTMGQFGIQAELTVSPTGKLAVESWSDGSFIYINDNHLDKWYMIIGSGDGGAGFNDITYVSARVAWVVYGPAEGFSGYGQVYKTSNAGHHWSLVKL